TSPSTRSWVRRSRSSSSMTGSRETSSGCALDAQTRARMQDALARLWEQKRKTVLFVTHDAEEALYLADRVVVLSQRPGHVKAHFKVDMPGAGSLETRLAAAFLALKRQVWEAAAGMTKGAAK